MLNFFTQAVLLFRRIRFEPLTYCISNPFTFFFSWCGTQIIFFLNWLFYIIYFYHKYYAFCVWYFWGWGECNGAEWFTVALFCNFRKATRFCWSGIFLGGQFKKIGKFCHKHSKVIIFKVVSLPLACPARVRISARGLPTVWS